MDIRKAIKQRRTIRRFENRTVTNKQLKDLVELARLYASGANLQPIRFIGVTTPELRDAIFKGLRWAAYLPGFEILPEHRPMAYIVLTCDGQKKASCRFDLGAAATTLMLAAEGEGLATCALASFNREKLIEDLQIPENVEPLLVIALGYPAQKSKAVPYAGDVKYFEDEAGELCVPKFSLEEVLTLC